MLDRKTDIILNILSNSSNGDYKVLEIAYIIERLPQKYASTTYDEISNILKYLKDLEYIDIKYFDESEVCFVVLPKSKIYEENLLEDKKLNRKIALVLLMSGIVSGVCGFCGAFLSHILFG